MTTPSVLKLFIAAPVPRAFQEACASMVEDLGRTIPNARWVRPEGIHITFKFLGPTDPVRAAPISEAIGAIARDVEPFDLITGVVGFFGSSRRPRVLWIGVQGELELASRLVLDLEEAMERFGFEKEERPFAPHVTLARFESERGTVIPQDLLARAAMLSGIPIPVEELILFQSLPGRGGSRYTPYGRFPLGRRP